MKPQPITMSELTAEWDALGILRDVQRETEQRMAERVPPGWKSCEEWAEAAHLSIPQTRKVLNDGVRIGRLECRQFRTATGQGVRPVRYFRQKA